MDSTRGKRVLSRTLHCWFISYKALRPPLTQLPDFWSNGPVEKMVFSILTPSCSICRFAPVRSLDAALGSISVPNALANFVPKFSETASWTSFCVVDWMDSISSEIINYRLLKKLEMESNGVVVLTSESAKYYYQPDYTQIFSSFIL